MRTRAFTALVTGGCLAVFAAIASLWAVDAGGARALPRENAVDLLVKRLTPPPDAPIVVVDIDSESLQLHGAWPWSRVQLARLVEAVAAGKPAVIGLDMLLSGPDRLSQAAIARRLAVETGRADLATIARELVDGDAELAEAMRRAPVVLGAVLADESYAAFDPPAPVLVNGAPRLSEVWAAPAAIGPEGPVLGAAAGVGLVVFDNDADGVARRAPLLAVAGATPIAGFAAETLRVAREASSLVVDDGPPRLSIGDIVAPLDADATLRFRASDPAVWAARTLPAAGVLAGVHADAMRGKIVLVGASAPEVGLLRRTAAARAAPAVQIEADAIATLWARAAPSRPAWVAPVETAGAFLLGLCAIAAATRLRPARGAIVVAALLVAWMGGAAFMLRALTIVDPAGPPALGALAYAITAIVAAVGAERRERRLRGRFEQHLAPAVVARLLADPDAVRMEGESREVTALFTDIEGFTAMTELAEPRELIALLDDYFQMLTDIVVAHGGMVDKFVGDAIHALFNAPLDLPDHPRRALECAIALRDASVVFRETPRAKALGLGRTRIGLETGVVIVGDVGGRRKLDYTAHGTAINTAARMEAANKELGTTICVGPRAAARIPPPLLRSLGKISVRGRSEALEVFEPVH